MEYSRQRRIWGVFEDGITLADYLEDRENEAPRKATRRTQLQESCLSKLSGGPQCPVQHPLYLFVGLKYFIIKILNMTLDKVFIGTHDR